MPESEIVIPYDSAVDNPKKREGTEDEIPSDGIGGARGYRSAVRSGPRGARDSTAGASSPGFPALRVDEPERHMAVPLRREERGTGPDVAERPGGLPAGDHGAV